LLAGMPTSCTAQCTLPPVQSKGKHLRLVSSWEDSAPPPVTTTDDLSNTSGQLDTSTASAVSMRPRLALISWVALAATRARVPTDPQMPVEDAPSGTQDARHPAGSRSRTAPTKSAAMAARLGRRSTRLGVRLGHCLSRAVCGDLLGFRRLSDRLWAVDGKRAEAVCAADLRPALCQHGDQYRALRRPRRERADVPCAAAVRLLHAPAAVDQGAADRFHPALGAAGSADVPVFPLDADRRARAGRRHIAGPVRHRRPDLVQSPRARARIQHRRLHLEMAAVLDRDPARRPNGRSAGDLRSGGRRRRHRDPPFRPCHRAAAGESLSGMHAALHPLDARRLHRRKFRLRRRAGKIDRCAGDARHPLCVRCRRAGARRGRHAVGPADSHPAGDRVDVQGRSQGGSAVNPAASFGLRARWPRHRVRRFLIEAGSAVLGMVLLIWSLMPVYNMLLIALDPEGDNEFSGDIWPPEPSLDSFRAVWSEGHWYLEHFWSRFGNSLYVGLLTMVLTVAIGSLASFAVGRMRLGRARLLTNAALL